MMHEMIRPDTLESSAAHNHDINLDHEGIFQSSQALMSPAAHGFYRFNLLFFHGFKLVFFFFFFFMDDEQVGILRELRIVNDDEKNDI